MSKLQLIIAREFKAKVKNKSFIMMTFLSPVIMIAMMALIVFLMKQNDQKIKDIVYVDNSGIFSKDNFKDTETIKYKDFTTFGIEETKKKVEAGDHFGVLIIPKQDSLELLANSVEFYSKDTPGLNTIENIERNVNTHLRNLKMKELGINLEKIKAAKISSDIKMYNFSGEKSSKMINNMKIGVGTIAGYLLMMFMILYGTSVMRSVIEEKTSRIVEVIVSSVKPFQLMLGKIVGNGAAGLLQFFIWGVLLLLGAVVVSLFIGIDTSQVFSQDIDANQVAKMQALMGNKAELFLEIRKLPWFTLFFLFIFYFLGGYMLYSSLFAAVGAAVDNETDTQQFMTPIMLPLMLAVYVGAFTVVNDPHGPVSVIFSYIPLTSPIVMLMRVPFGVAWWEIALSMLLLVFSFIAIVWVAAKIYRVGILMYGKKPTYKDLWKWMRYGS
ncbi:ABC transporter permease [Tenacibaculum dicentrarchi]|nr:ABC transporter permease [Tenacibaculum dicentrarchi]MCD8415449.1 ABC transporter permease [Tenacibaculum dicentrarchi]MCD8420449.1 ABC transporter permease [Tenacibaculum dicentrarchi]MCD8423844.1 ABC transporter permease [Tenacibaculum dicentrarchi]MCD8436825.1 ABC transporter permease [Tenacibaculum dicentrarchi]